MLWNRCRNRPGSVFILGFKPTNSSETHPIPSASSSMAGTAAVKTSAPISPIENFILFIAACARTPESPAKVSVICCNVPVASLAAELTFCNPYKVSKVKSSLIVPAIAAVGGLIAVGILLYKNWDTIKAKAGELAQSAYSPSLQFPWHSFLRLHFHWQLYDFVSLTLLYCRKAL